MKLKNKSVNRGFNRRNFLALTAGFTVFQIQLLFGQIAGPATASRPYLERAGAKHACKVLAAIPAI